MTVREIAKRCNVSAATVSRVLRGRANADSPSHQRILELVRDGGVTPRRRARKSGLILCVSSGGSTEDLTHAPIIESHLNEFARRQDFGFLTLHSAKAEAVQETLHAHDVAGLIWLDAIPSVETTLPAVIVNGPCFSHSGPSAVECDDASGVVTALRHLARLGHARVGFFADAAVDEYTAHPRKACIARLYREAGLEYKPQLVFGRDFGPHEHPGAIREAVRHFLKLRPRPTAVFTYGDIYAPHFYDELRSRNLDVPGDVSIVGFDDFSVCRMIQPALTTIRKPLEKMAFEAIRVLGERVRDPSLVSVRVLVRPELVKRDSVRDLTASRASRRTARG